MVKLFEFLKGKKTYLIAFVIAVLGTLQGLGWFTTPDWVYPVLAGIGGITLRSGVNNSIADAVKNGINAPK